MSHRQSNDIQAELAALADGSLLPERRTELLARVRESREQSEGLELQRGALASMRPLERIAAPPSLRQSIGELTRSAPARHRRRRTARLRLAGAGALAASLAAALVLVLVLGTGASSPPTVLEASSLALRPATLASPVENPRERGLLESSVEGVPYPYWGGHRGWRTAGARVDRLGGHTVTTVFYAARDGGRIGYSIVAGGPLPAPSGGDVVAHDGVRFHVLDARGATVLTWREAGHTCILAGRGVAPRTLLHLVD